MSAEGPGMQRGWMKLSGREFSDSSSNDAYLGFCIDATEKDAWPAMSICFMSTRPTGSTATRQSSRSIQIYSCPRLLERMHEKGVF